jgi:CRP-like cAMP-binding protein
MNQGKSKKLEEQGLLAAMCENVRERLLTSSVLKAARAGEVICREGDVGDELFIVLDGRLRVVVDCQSAPKEVASLGKGAFFGEMTVLGDARRNATVVAQTDCLLLCIGRQVLESLFPQFPGLRQILAAVGLRRAEHLVGALSAC